MMFGWIINALWIYSPLWLQTSLLLYFQQNPLLSKVSEIRRTLVIALSNFGKSDTLHMDLIVHLECRGAQHLFSQDFIPALETRKHFFQITIPPGLLQDSLDSTPPYTLWKIEDMG